MAKPTTPFTLHGHQELGAVSKTTPQEDVFRAEFIRPDVALVVVADGEGTGPKTKRAAELAVETAFKVVREYASGDPARALKMALDEANSTVYRLTQGAGVTVALTAAVISAKTLTWIQAGNVQLYWVREKKEGKIERLGRNTSALLGLQPDIKAEVATRELQEGDHLLFGTAGLFRSRAEQKELLKEAEIASEIVRYPPLEAARVFISLAMGRDADDNVTAVVVELPGAGRLKKDRRPLLGIAVGVLVALALAVVVAQLLPEPAAPPNFGDGRFIVLVSTSAEPAQGESPGGTLVTTRAKGKAVLVFNNEAVVILNQNTKMEARFVPKEASLSAPPQVVLAQGQILIAQKTGSDAPLTMLAQITGTSQIAVRAETPTNVIGLETTLNAEQHLSATAYCLFGTCVVVNTTSGETLQSFNAGEQVTLGLNNRDEVGQPTPFEPSVKDRFFALCTSGCQLPKEPPP